MITPSRKEYSLLLSGFFKPAQVRLDFDIDKWSTFYTAEETAALNRLWEIELTKATKHGRPLHDSSLFRLAGVERSPDGVMLKVGLTSYREYVATRNPSIELRRADPIGTVVLPITSDNRVPLGRRNSRVEQNVGQFFAFGGYFDADMDLDTKSLEPDLFKCASREVEEEVGLKIDRSAFSLIAITYDHLYCHPEAAFVTRLNLSANEFEQLSWSEELTDLRFVHLLGLSDFLEQFATETTNTVVGALRVLEAQRGHEWFNR